MWKIDFSIHAARDFESQQENRIYERVETFSGCTECCIYFAQLLGLRFVF